MQNATDFRVFAPKILDLGANLLLEFLNLILAWSSKSLIRFFVVNLGLKGFVSEARKITLFEEGSVTGIPVIFSYLSKGLGRVWPTDCDA